MSKEQSSVAKAWEATLRKTQAARRRANSIFGSISVAHADDDNVEDNDHNIAAIIEETYHAEKILPNGDYYTGQWCDNFPHGLGKYLWTDGCMYVGEWYRGKTMGKGRFSWPSGATYEGEFKSGYMDGIGTYTGSNSDTYRGQWVMNLKHGHGVKSYANGDWYDGEWRCGMHEGQGKYNWKNGNCYIGEWRKGIICGQGIFVWSNGNRFDGYWEDGLPKGHGIFKWPDESFYEGNWSRDPNEQNGIYYPPESSLKQEISQDWDPQNVYNVDLFDCKISDGEKVAVLPSQKKLAVWNSSKNDEKPRRMSIDGRVSVSVEKPVDRMQIWECTGDATGTGTAVGTGTGSATTAAAVGGFDDVVYDEITSVIGRISNGDFLAQQIYDANAKLSPLQPLRLPRPGKRQGETISRGHKNYELMLNLQLGIRHSVGRPGPAASLDLKASAFDPKEKVWTKFPPEGSKHTPPHQSGEFKWKDYCPLVFRTLRKLFKVDPADYMISICGNDALRELSSPGKSGSFFYLTNDDHYMIKTVKKSEVKVLLRMLPAYYNHFRAYENTLVIKFYGLHCVKLTGPIQRKVRFIIMGNLFCSEYTIHRRYDLKGSSLGRRTEKPESDTDETTILKDLDLNFIFRLQKSWFQEFCRQIDRDCDFLEQERIMDYSLLVGLHFKAISEDRELIPCGNGTEESPPGDAESEAIPRLSRVDMDQLLLDPVRWARIRLGGNMPARVERTVRRGNYELQAAQQLIGGEPTGGHEYYEATKPTGEYYEVTMFFGIIDILQDYDITKKLEHAYKSIQYDPTSISAVDPKQYSRRFRDFIFHVFAEDIAF